MGRSARRLGEEDHNGRSFARPQRQPLYVTPLVLALYSNLILPLSLRYVLYLCFQFTCTLYVLRYPHVWMRRGADQADAGTIPACPSIPGRSQQKRSPRRTVVDTERKLTLPVSDRARNKPPISGLSPVPDVGESKIVPTATVYCQPTAL